MPVSAPSDDEVMRVGESQLENRKRYFALSIWASIATTLLFVWFMIHLKIRFFNDPSMLFLVFLFYVATTMIFWYFIAFLFQVPKRFYSKEVMIKKIDQWQGRYRSTVGINSLFILILSIEIFKYTPKFIAGDYSFGDYQQDFDCAVYIIYCLSIFTQFGVKGWLMGVVEDELIRSYRHSAIEIGLWCGMVAIAGDFILGLYDPITAVALLPSIVGIVAGTMSLRFYILARQSVPRD